MIQVEINGQQVEVGKGGLKLDLVNPHLLYDGIPASTIAVPNFPATALNQQVFGWWHEPTASGSLKDFSWRHFFRGELIREGFFRLKEASLENGYVGEFDDRLRNFFADAGQSTLPELALGTLPLQLPASGMVQDAGQNAYCLPTIENPDYFGTNGGSISYTGRLNDYASGAYLGSTTPKCPQFFLPYVLKRLAAALDFTISGNFLTDPVLSNLLLFNTREAGATVTIAQHVPNLRPIDFLLELRKLFNLQFDFDAVNRTLAINFWDEKLALPAVADWSGKAVRGETRVPETRPRLQLGSELDGGDALMKDKPAELTDYLTPVYAGSSYQEAAVIRSKFSTLLTNPTTGLAMCKQPGVTAQFNQLTATFAPRLLFWNGMAGGLPAATNERAGVKLTWTGATGLAATYWKNMEALRGGQFYLKKRFLLNELDLATLQFDRKIHCHGVDYLVVNIAVDNPITDAASCLLLGFG